MGRANALAVFAMWPELATAPKLLLVGMALRSLDPPGGKDGRPPFLYFDGEDGLLHITGRNRSATYRALSALVEVGAVDVVDNGRHGHKAVYRVQCNPLAKPAKRPKVRTLKGPNVRTEGSESSDVKGPNVRTPRRTQGDEVNVEEEMAGVTTDVQTARDDAGDEGEMTHDRASAYLQKRVGIEKSLELMAEHEREHSGCPDLLVCIAEDMKRRDALRVVKGGRSA